MMPVALEVETEDNISAQARGFPATRVRSTEHTRGSEGNFQNYARLSKVLSDFFTPAFQRLLNDDHELVGDGAVDDAVVVAESEMDDRTDGDGVSAVLIGDDERLFSNTAYSHDGDVGLVNDRQPEDGTELSGVCDGEGRTFHIGGHEFLGTGALA